MFLSLFQTFKSFSVLSRFCFIFTFIFFFFNDTATTEIYTLSLHDALPISSFRWVAVALGSLLIAGFTLMTPPQYGSLRSEEHTSELQSQSNLVCRLLLEKKKKKYNKLYQ